MEKVKIDKETDNKIEESLKEIEKGECVTFEELKKDFENKKRKRSKNLKEAKERFKKACKNKDPEEIAIASAEILIYDKEHSDVLVCAFMFGLPVLEKIKINLSKLDSRQIRNFVIQEWEVFKNKKKKEKDKFKLSEEQEKRVINAVAHALREIKKREKAESKIQLFSLKIKENA